MEEIELLDGASADFDQELVSKGELTPVFFGFCADKLWCGDFSGALPVHDNLSTSAYCR